MIRLRSWLLICAREYKLLQSVCQVQLLENMLFHFQSNFTGAPLEFLQYNYFEELPFLKTYQQQTTSMANVFISSLKTLGAFSIEFIASVGSFQIEEEFFFFLFLGEEKNLSKYSFEPRLHCSEPNAPPTRACIYGLVSLCHPTSFRLGATREYATTKGPVKAPL